MGRGGQPPPLPRRRQAEAACAVPHVVARSPPQRIDVGAPRQSASGGGARSPPRSPDPSRARATRSRRLHPASSSTPVTRPICSPPASSLGSGDSDGSRASQSPRLEDGSRAREPRHLAGVSPARPRGRADAGGRAAARRRRPHAARRGHGLLRLHVGVGRRRRRAARAARSGCPRDLALVALALSAAACLLERAVPDRRSDHPDELPDFLPEPEEDHPWVEVAAPPGLDAD